MAQLPEAVSRYHKLLEKPQYRDLAWAEQLHREMRQQSAGESNRFAGPVLRPHFISRRQLQSLTSAAERFATILDQLEPLALASPVLLNRMQMLPVEKMLAAMPSGYSRFNITARMDGYLENGSLRLRDLEACNPAGLAYSDMLSSLFADLPIMKEFKRGRYKISKLGSAKYLLRTVLDAWKDFGGRSKPNIAIVELSQPFDPYSTEGHLLARLFTEAGYPARLIAPDSLEYSHRKLRSGDFEISIVFRRLLVRELLTHFDLSHPLLLAYRDRSVCVVNNFRSELAQRRAFLDLVTDEAVTSKLSAADRKLIRDFVPWTRVVAQKKTSYRDRMVDLPAFVLHSRNRLVLRPNEDGDGARAFIGAEMSDAAWEKALHIALRTPYVVQEHVPSCRQSFPTLEYGEFRMQHGEVTVHPYLLNGKMRAAAAAVHLQPAGAAAHIATAPLFLLRNL